MRITLTPQGDPALKKRWNSHDLNSRRREFVRALACLLLAAPAWALHGDESPALWQERFFWDGLLTARDRVSRGQSDPLLVPVMKNIAGQAAQQIANIQQIQSFVKAQHDNLRYAFDQPDPGPSLQTISDNLDTLATGAVQVRHNLYYLTARCRLASSQALPDPEVNQASLLILGQIQQLQLALNALYLDTAAARAQVVENSWAADKHFNHKVDLLYRSVVRVQDSVFKAYNSALELHLRSK